MRSAVRNGMRSAINLSDGIWTCPGTIQLRRLSRFQESVKQPNLVTFLETLVVGMTVVIPLLISMGIGVMVSSTMIDVT